MFELLLLSLSPLFVVGAPSNLSLTEPEPECAGSSSPAQDGGVFRLAIVADPDRKSRRGQHWVTFFRE